MSRALGLGFSLVFLAACSVTDVVNVLTPRSSFSLEKNVFYAPGDRHRLDIYSPIGATGAEPVVVFFYGGSWQRGAKEDYLFVGEAFASKGFVTVIPDYRVYPDVRFPGFLEDGAAAVAWVRTTLAADRTLYLVGHSAGGYIAVMLALDPRWLGDRGLEPCATIAATAGLSGPYDFLPVTSPALTDIFGTVEAAAATQPISFANGGAPPLLLATGSDDETVNPSNTVRMANRVREAGGTADTVYYEGLDHVDMVAALASPLRGRAPVLEDVVDFFRQHTETRDAGCASLTTRRRP